MNNMCVLLTQPAKGQRGMALVSALMLLLVISLLAVGLSMDSSMDVRGAAYQRFRAQAFGSTEAALMAATDILEENALMDDSASWNHTDPFTLPTLSDQYVGDIEILQQGGFYMDKNPGETPTIKMSGDIEATITTQYLNSTLSTGGAINVAAGYGGAAKSVSEGGGLVIYNIESTGRDNPDGGGQATTDLGLNYRHVL